MKHTRKMIMVPEAEYLTLLNMIKGNDNLKTEKAMAETKISKVLRDPKLSEGAKARKYNWLLKQKRQLAKEIERESGKSKNVLIDPEQIKAFSADISKYLGIVHPPPKQSPPPQLKTEPKKSPNKRRKSEPAGVAPNPPKEATRTKPSVTDEESDELFADAPEAFITAPNTTPSDPYIIHPDYHTNLMSFIRENEQKLKVKGKTKEVLSQNGRYPIVNSNYKNVVDYLTGQIKEKPFYADALIDRMKDEKYFKKLLESSEYYRMRGEGRGRHKKYTRGLVRVKKIQPLFKPTIWERI